jgi:hypothetical protein
MNTQNTISAQLDKANAVLIGLADRITSGDRSAAMEKYSRITVYTYLKGEGKDLDTAMDLIGILQQRIEERTQRLNSVV